MSLSLNGTSQYVSLGDATNIYQTRPWTVAALIETTSLRTAGNYNAVYSQGNYDASTATLDRGWGMEIEAAAPGRLYFSKSASTAVTVSSDVLSTFTITANTGWWLVGVVCRSTGAATVCDFFGYRYSTGALSVNAAAGGTSTDDNGTVPIAGDTTILGAFKSTAGIADFYPGKIGWVAVFSGDLGNSGQVGGSASVWELITRGPWRMVRGDYSGVAASSVKGFWPLMAEYALVDQSTGAHNGSLVAAPTYGAPGPTEWPQHYRVPTGIGKRPRIFAPGLAR